MERDSCTDCFLNRIECDIAKRVLQRTHSRLAAIIAAGGQVKPEFILSQLQEIDLEVEVALTKTGNKVYDAGNSEEAL